VNYRLTEKGIDLAPVLLELLIWGARHERTGAPGAVADRMASDRAAVLAEVRRRWRDRDPTPFLPRFSMKGARDEQGSGPRRHSQGRVHPHV
jgi:hypothetical protein